MALLSDALKEKEFDIRMVSRKLSKGLMLEEEVTKHESTLPDESENCAYVNLEELHNEIRGRSGLR